MEERNHSDAKEAGIVFFIWFDITFMYLAIRHVPTSYDMCYCYVTIQNRKNNEYYYLHGIDNVMTPAHNPRIIEGVPAKWYRETIVSAPPSGEIFIRLLWDMRKWFNPHNLLHWKLSRGRFSLQFKIFGSCRFVPLFLRMRSRMPHLNRKIFHAGFGNLFVRTQKRIFRCRLGNLIRMGALMRSAS